MLETTISLHVSENSRDRHIILQIFTTPAEFLHELNDFALHLGYGRDLRHYRVKKCAFSRMCGQT
jgi:hypothetical protein